MQTPTFSAAEALVEPSGDNVLESVRERIAACSAAHGQMAAYPFRSGNAACERAAVGHPAATELRQLVGLGVDSKVIWEVSNE